MVASFTIRNLHDDVKKRLEERATRNGRSIEAEIREILYDALVESLNSDSENLTERIRAHMALLGGVDLELPSRLGPDREPPTFD